jgi:hypothetical protein
MQEWKDMGMSEGWMKQLHLHDSYLLHPRITQQQCDQNYDYWIV